MEIKTKFVIGDVLSTIGHKYIGKVAKIQVTIEKVEKLGVQESIGTKICYSILGNEKLYDVEEEYLYLLEPAKKLEIVKEIK